jgi:putative heme iron utilization protein
MTGIDAEGLDLRRQGAVGRLDFEVPLSAAKGAREVLVRLAQAARK